MFGLLPFFNSRKGEAKPVLSDERALLNLPYGGKWYHAAKDGRLFSGSAAATGIVLPIFSATAQKFGVWNPAGSGVNLSVVSVSMSYVDTTGASGGFCWAINKNIGSSLATGAISAFTEGVPDRGCMATGSNGGSKVLFTPSAATTIAPVVWRQIGWNQTVLTATDATNIVATVSKEYDGELTIGPGNAIWLCGNIATLSKWAPSMVWVEEPV